MKKKKSIQDFYAMKEKGEPITFITSYDYPTATFAERANMDMILVGDSLGMCVYGYEGTMPVTMDMMIVHSEAVRRGAPNTYVIGDMPFLSYQTSDQAAVENAGRFYKEARVDAIKLEGGVRVSSRIKAIVDAGMLVMGHIGLTPQSSSQLGGFKAQGRTLDSAKAQVEDALAVQEAGAAMILLEAIPPEVSGYIRDTLTIPVLSIGAGPYCDGQLLDRQRHARGVRGLYAQIRETLRRSGENLHRRTHELRERCADQDVPRTQTHLSHDSG